MKWINVLHLYQPPTQTREIIDQVVKESYETILGLLDRYPKLKLTINISGSLLELLMKYNHSSIIDRLRAHAERGAIEFLGSAMYHPILPLLEEKEISRQIHLNNEISKKCFGEAFQPRGFYFPEMAYSCEAGIAIKKAGFAWTILDEIHTVENTRSESLYVIKENGLGVIFRNSAFSRTFPPESIVQHINKISSSHLITCHDGELYGHWHKDDRGFYEKAFTNLSIETLTVSEYLAHIADTQEPQEIPVRDASWESLPEELAQKIPLGLWQDPKNEIHARLEAFKKQVLIIVEHQQNNRGYTKARHHADRGIASCAWWWASERKIGPFSPVSWNPTEIEKGANELYHAVLSLEKIPEKDLAPIDAEFKNLRALIWQKHKAKYDPSYQNN